MILINTSILYFPFCKLLHVFSTYTSFLFDFITSNKKIKFSIAQSLKFLISLFHNFGLIQVHNLLLLLKIKVWTKIFSILLKTLGCLRYCLHNNGV